MSDRLDHVTCALCAARTTGRLPYGLADESWAAVKDAFGRWRGICPDHREAVAWASSRLPPAPAMDGRKANEA
jgi:hypothetical protein